MTAITFRETPDASPGASFARDAVALRFDPSRRVTLRFQLVLHDEAEMEALRYARRVMIREERGRGLEWDEPSMEDPALSGTEIRWFALASQVAWCRQKIVELVERSNRAVAEIRARRPEPERYPE
jgi:hypothetical protein